jgi:type II secretory pathway component GspD/PulD (secretin)
MKYRTRLVMACAIAVALVASVAAQSSIVKPVARAAEDPLAKRVSLDLKAMAPADAFGTLAESTGLKVHVDPAVTAPVDILVRNVTARTALTTMCESIGCEWSVTGGTLSIKPARAGERGVGRGFVARDKAGNVVSSSEQATNLLKLLKQPLPAGMKFENTPIDQVSTRISEALGTTVALTSTDPAMQRMTIDLSGRSLEAGLRELAASGTGDYRLGLMTKPDPTGKTQSPSIMIAIRKPGREKK